MERVKEIFGYFVAAMAMFSLLCSIYEAMNGRLKSSGLLAGLFVAASLLMYLPQIELFKGFGIEAKLQIQQKLDKAQEILEQVRKLSLASAKSSYFNIAWSNRLGGIDPREKQRLLDGVDEQLRSVGTSETERREAARPHLDLIGYDFYVAFYKLLPAAVSRQKVSSDLDNKAVVIQEWTNKHIPRGVLPMQAALVDGEHLSKYLFSQIDSKLVSQDDYDKLTGIADKIGRIFDGCIRRNGYTDDAFYFFNLPAADLDTVYKSLPN
jgi:hypothetical protein